MASPTPASITAFTVNGNGFEQTAGHYEYVFDAVHSGSGCSWRFQKRFSDFLASHRKLSRSFGSLPTFPPNGFPGLGLFMGRDFAEARAEGLQAYFGSLVERVDVTRDAEFQRMLGT